MKSLSHVRLLATPWTCSLQAPPSMEFSRQEYWSGVPLPSSFYHIQFSSVQFSRSGVSDSLRLHESQHTRPPCPSQTPGDDSNSCPSSCDAIQPSHPLLPHFLPAPNPSQHQGLFQRVNSSHEVAKGLEFQLQHQSFQ